MDRSDALAWSNAQLEMPSEHQEERSPLPPALYTFVQQVVNHGMKERYFPVREEALAWKDVADREILEVGCGTGAVFNRGVAIDLDYARVHSVHRTGRPAASADAMRLPFADGTFSRVYCEGVLHHIDDHGAITSLKEMLRVCHSEGRVVLMDNVWPRSPLRVIPWLLRRMDYGRHVRTEEQLRSVVDSSGCKVLWARRLTYATIGLEGLIAVLLPSEQATRV